MHEPILSDFPHLARTHHTAGYRDGITHGQHHVAQDSFNAGFPLGISWGLRAGKVLGIIAFASAGECGPDIVAVCQRAQVELERENLLRDLLHELAGKGMGFYLDARGNDGEAGVLVSDKRPGNGNGSGGDMGGMMSTADPAAGVGPAGNSGLGGGGTLQHQPPPRPQTPLQVLPLGSGFEPESEPGSQVRPSPLPRIGPPPPYGMIWAGSQGLLTAGEAVSRWEEYGRLWVKKKGEQVENDRQVMQAQQTQQAQQAQRFLQGPRGSERE